MMRRDLGGAFFALFLLLPRSPSLYPSCNIMTYFPRNVGVVDAQLKVYDTANVRVVDASILPMQLSAHLSASLYGVAEKAADLIKVAHK
jgi:hypothetical protein